MLLTAQNLHILISLHVERARSRLEHLLQFFSRFCGTVKIVY